MQGCGLGVVNENKVNNDINVNRYHVSAPSFTHYLSFIILLIISDCQVVHN